MVSKVAPCVPVPSSRRWNRNSNGKRNGQAAAGNEADGHAQDVSPRSRADRYQVVVHVDEAALRGGAGRSDLALETIRRLACDSSVTVPGCRNTQFLDAHHLTHWADGGETSAANTALLCTRHHRLVHEGAFRMRGATTARSSSAGRTGASCRRAVTAPRTPLPIPSCSRSAAIPPWRRGSRR